MKKRALPKIGCVPLLFLFVYCHSHSQRFTFFLLFLFNYFFILFVLYLKSLYFCTRFVREQSRMFLTNCSQMTSFLVRINFF